MSFSNRIEIAAAPATVREKFLSFSTLPTYHKSFFTSIIAQGALDPGQKLTVVFADGNKMDPEILSNTPTAFSWRGSIPLLFGGDHTFSFLPSQTTPGGTTFVQEEKFFGMLGFLMGDGVVARSVGFREKTLKGWERFNGDFKGWCEK